MKRQVGIIFSKEAEKEIKSLNKTINFHDVIPNLMLDVAVFLKPNFS